MKKIAEILLYLWQLPQNLVGLLVFAVVRDGTRIDDGTGTLLLFSPRMRGGISLGRYVIIADRYVTDFKVWDHELGHAKQSKILGWLYLPVIGLPSLLWAAWWNEDRGISYYSFYTERWADHLGNVQRDE